MISATRIRAGSFTRCATARWRPSRSGRTRRTTARSTRRPLYVVLLDEYERWTGDRKLVRDLEYEARAALNWIDEFADLMGNGYISYKRRNEQTGIENQSWKDSWNSISYSDGRLPGFPRATCELQGYAYDAKLRGARLARTIWNDPAYADRLEQEAHDLKKRFNRDFWVADRGYFALALDADGAQVDSLASNNGLLLWSGIVDEAKAKSVVEHLMGPRLYSGWGVRTLAVGEARYNPIGYHLGTVWPFDNSFIAWGLRRYGFKEEAARIASDILDAAALFDGRLPEAFGGYDRALTKYPVQYPTACGPQAWSTGAPLLLLRTMLGLEPIGDHLIVDPALPAIDRPPRAARHPRSLGADRRLRPWPGPGRTGGGRSASPPVGAGHLTERPGGSALQSPALHSPVVNRRRPPRGEALRATDPAPRARHEGWRAPTRDLGRGARQDRRRVPRREGGPRPDDIRHLQLQQGDQRGQLRGAEVQPDGPGQQQHRQLQPDVTRP